MLAAPIPSATMYEMGAGPEGSKRESPRNPSEGEDGFRSQGTTGYQQTRPLQQEAASTQRQRAPFYVDDEPVQGVTERRLTVRQILEKAGKGTDVEVFRLRGKDDPKGSPIDIEEPIEASVEAPCYLRTEERAEEERAVGVKDIQGAAQRSSEPASPKGAGLNPPRGAA